MIEEYLGISSDYLILGMAALLLVLIVLLIVFIVQMGQLKKRYRIFMSGKNARSLEETLSDRWDQIDDLIESNAANERNIDVIFKRMKFDFQKYGLVKYDAFDEMGGKLSFSLAMLNEKNDGFIINAVHSHGGCYTYVKEIIDAQSIITLAEEEQEALNQALNPSDPHK